MAPVLNKTVSKRARSVPRSLEVQEISTVPKILQNFQPPCNSFHLPNDYQNKTSFLMELYKPRDPNSLLIKSWAVLFSSGIKTTLDGEAKFKTPCGSSLASTVRTASYPWLSKTAAPEEDTPAKQSTDYSE